MEVRVPVDTTETPNVFEDDWPDATVLAVETAGPGVLATLIVPTQLARQWAGELFAAVSIVYCEITADPHALTDDEIAALPAADAYQLSPGLLLAGDQCSPARARFHVALELEAEFLSTGGLRAAIVEALRERFTVARMAVSAGEPIAGRPAFGAASRAACTTSLADFKIGRSGYRLMRVAGGGGRKGLLSASGDA